MGRLLPLLAFLLLAAAAVAEARVVQAPETERGGQTVPRKAAGPDCIDAAAFRCAAAYQGGFGWFGVPDAEFVARLTAAARAELASGRPSWRRPRPLGRPLARPPWRLSPVGHPLLPRLH